MTDTTHHSIEPTAPPNFGRVAVWWGTGKGKTTAATGMAIRAAGRGYRVHILRFMKAGWETGENAVIEQLPTMSVEHGGHPGWHGQADGTDDAAHEQQAQAAFARAESLLDAAADADLTTPLSGPPEDGMHMLILDELLYAVEHGLVSSAAVQELIERKPDALELVLTGGHEQPTYLASNVDLISEVQKHKHPADEGVSARRGIEY